MIVGVLYLVLSLPASESLKDKRQVVKSVLARVRNQFNVAAAEVDTLDYRQSATLGFSCVSNAGVKVFPVIPAARRTSAPS